MHRSIGRLRLTALAVLAVAVASCKVREERLPETGATLEGTVKYGAEDVQFAMILVQTDQGGVTGKVGADGRYRVENVPLGEVKVGVNTAAAQGDFMSKSMAAGAYQGPEAKGKGKVKDVKFVAVPEKYYDPATSGLTTTIQKGPNTFDIVISK